MIAVVATLVLCLAGPSPSPRAPGGGDEVATLANKLRDPRLTLDQREQLRAQLLTLGEEGARALQRHVEERAGKLEDSADKREKRYLSDLDKAARKLVDARLTKKTLAEVETLRKQVNALRNEAALTKERIHEVGDPAIARLVQLLDVALEDVLAANVELADARRALSEELYELEQEFETWERCNAELPERRRSKALSDPASRWPAIEAAEAWACLMATPMSNSDRDALERNRELERELPELEEGRGVLDLNRIRIRLGLNAVVIDVKLCAAARDHSKDMHTLGFFAHESPVEGKKTPWDRAARFGTSAGAENIAMGQSTGADANVGWWYSPGHHKNMLGGHSRVGLGKFERHWTQMFG